MGYQGYRIVFTHGPRDGEVVINNIDPYLPTVINGKEIQFFPADEAYVLVEADHEQKVAIYQHIGLMGKSDETYS